MGSPRAQHIRQFAEAQRWWEAAAAAAQVSLDDPDVLLIAAQAWISLGLPALAAESLDRLCAAFPSAEQHEQVVSLRTDLRSLPCRSIDQNVLQRRVVKAAAGLADRGLDIQEATDRWLASNQDTTIFVAADGNTVRSRVDGTLELVGDHRSASRSLVEQHRTALIKSHAPITIEGLDPPWLAFDMLDATAADGYAPGLRIVQADMGELLDGCSLVDTDEFERLTASPRVEWFAGPSAAAALGESIARSPGVSHEGPMVPLATLRTQVGPALAQALQTSVRRQAAEHAACIEIIRERDRTATDSRRIQAIADGSPRIALIAGRFTTVLRPMIEDLAAAFASLGATTKIITEPNDHSRLTPFAYTQAFTELDPDLIVCANHTRDDMDRLLGESVMPRSVPWVTWVQDAMPHLLRPEAGRSVGPTDLAIGHISQPMRQQFGYAEDRSISVPMVASEQKFNPDRIDAALASEFACEIAAFTNHSETPLQMRARLIDEVSGSPGAAAAVEQIANAALDLAREPIERVLGWHRCEGIVDSIAPRAEPDTRENLLQNVALRVYDRACRHNAFEWAQQVADRNGWRFALYGRGWESHPTLASAARGVVEHGTPICSAYAAASITLDATVLTSLHQRVAECALAGGLPSVLLTGSVAKYARAMLKQRLNTVGTQFGIPVREQPGIMAVPAYRVLEAERFTRFDSLVNRASYPYVFVNTTCPPLTIPPGMINADDIIDLLELGVRSPRSLERIVHSAHNAVWREAQRTRALRYIRQHCTHSVLATRILKHYTSLNDDQTVAA